MKKLFVFLQVNKPSDTRLVTPFKGVVSGQSVTKVEVDLLRPVKAGIYVILSLKDFTINDGVLTGTIINQKDFDDGL